jgi:hypothetical protein
VDEIAANSGQSSVGLTSASGSGSDDIGHMELVVVDTFVDPDDGNSEILIEDATLDDVLLCPLGKSSYHFYEL